MTYTTSQLNQLNDIANLSGAPIVITGKPGTGKSRALKLVSSRGRKFYAPDLDGSVLDDFDATYGDIFKTTDPEELVYITEEDSSLFNEIKEHHKVYTHINCHALGFDVTHHGDTMFTEAELNYTSEALALVKYLCASPTPIVVGSRSNSDKGMLEEYIMKECGRYPHDTPGLPKSKAVFSIEILDYSRYTELLGSGSFIFITTKLTPGGPLTVEVTPIAPKDDTEPSRVFRAKPKSKEVAQ